MQSVEDQTGVFKTDQEESVESRSETLMIFWEILKKEKRQNLMRIGEDVIWNRLHLLLLRQGLCLGCQEAVYRGVEVLKEDLGESGSLLYRSEETICVFAGGHACNMDILCLLQRASEVQSEEEEEREDVRRRLSIIV